MTAGFANTPLQYLIFDASDDGEGLGSWEAMASVQPDQWPALQAEVRSVLDWAEAHSPGPRGPLDEGGAWDADEQMSRDGEWITLTLTITGPWEWGEALVARFSAD